MNHDPERKIERPTVRAGDIGPRLNDLHLKPVYLYYGHTTHLVDTIVSNVDHGHVLCGRTPVWPMTWMGTGSQEEHDRAAAQPICRVCRDRLDRLEKARCQMRGVTWG